MTVATSRPVTNALLAALRAVHDAIGDAQAPQVDGPFAVLYPAGAGRLDGTLSDLHADAESLVQLTCVGTTREEAEFLADRLRPVLLGPLLITGRQWMAAWMETSQPVRRDDAVTPSLFYAVDQVRIATTPS